MSLPVALRNEARAEFAEAFDFYKARRPGLGVTFTARVQQVFDRIAANPKLHSVVFADVRKAAVAKFPDRVFDRLDTDRVLVLAVFHSARDPSAWQDRV